MEDPPTPPAQAATHARIRRLTVREYDATVAQLVHAGPDDLRAGVIFLPDDLFIPFDNIVAHQEPSDVWVAGAERAALATAQALREDEARFAEVMGCAPTGPGDADCLRSFIERFGRQALRRPMEAADVDELLDFALTEASATGDALDGAALVVSAILQDTGFLYRIEVGEALADDPERMKLDAFSRAARMAFLLTGAGPDDALMEAAAAGQLDTADGRAAVARTLLTAPSVEQHVLELHAMWLGYRSIPEVAEVAGVLRAEADALVRRVVFEQQAPWTDIWDAQVAWLNDSEALRYAIPPAGTGEERSWVDLTGTGRSGLIAQGAFMSVANNPLDTSPTKRGKLILQRLMCRNVGNPPPTVPADIPPDLDLGECKADRYKVHALDAGCASCHAALDGVGLGFERYDKVGSWREYEMVPYKGTINENCPLPEGGDVPGLGTYEDPAGFVDLLVDQGVVQACAVRHVLAFAKGDDVSNAPDPDVDALTAAFAASGLRFTDLLVEVAASDALAIVEVDP